ncbi:unnamed protein product [Dovyalis caffra]|uniref:protein-serine/threonine phosphatase n=1 Tax=Dovyalis caffra TaxID=77055 RepID=A0AAV1RK15_9ROSI|nr:unnamed protein product [Dovyalis caffra]
MADSTSSSEVGKKIRVKKSRNCRRRSLDAKQMIASAATCSMNITSNFLDEGKTKKIIGIKEVTSCEATKPAVSVKECNIDDHDLQDYKQLNSEKSSFPPSISSYKEKQVLQPLGTVEAGSYGDQEDEDKSPMSKSHGMISVIGRRRVMEDAVTMVPGIAVGEFGSYDLFAVYDGHGGARVANACRDRMHQLVAKEVKKGERIGGGKGLEYWEKLMVACFEKMDEELMINDGGGGGEGEMGKEATSIKNMGSTAVVVMVGKEEVVVANCGDSRAVLCRGGVAVPLSHDHKPDRPDERERVEAAGGRVINWNGSRVLGVLATSRSIGDHYLKPFVISEPEVAVSERTDSDDFIVIATDGLWDVVTNETACEVVRKLFYGQIKRRLPDEFNGSCSAEAAAMLAELAMARGSRDNISVIVVQLKKAVSKVC